ncbi:MAG TPA: glycosyltransferase family 4 protein [Geobacteraceae bacterium]
MAKPLKVLYLLHDSRRSGVPAVAVNFIRLAATIGVEPTVLFAYDGVYARELRGAGIPVTTLGGRTPFWWRAKRFLMNGYLATWAKRFDVIHIHSIKLAWSVLVARWLGARVVFHIHELPRRIGWLLRGAISAADEVVFCSETCAAHFAGVPARRRRTIVNAVHFPEHPPVRHEGAGRKVVMAGSINKNKGQDLLLQAFARLRSEEAELWLYGTTGLSAHGYVRELKRYAKAHGVAERVYFPGPTPDVFRVFAEASVVVHTSWTESFGMALVEAQSCGVPVIAHDLEGMREVVVDGVTGYLIEPGNVAALSERLDQLLADPELRNRLGGAGYAMVRDRFSMAARAPEYLSLYREVCGP